MTPFNSESPKFALNRIDRMIARSAGTSAAFITFMQAVPHAFSQAGILNPVWLWIGIGFISLAQLAQVFTAWFGRSAVPWFAALHLGTMAGIWLWPLMLQPGAQLASGDQPWFWWMLAIAGLNAFGAFKPEWAVGSAIALHLSWLFMSTTHSFGPRPFWISLQDTLLAFFFSILLGLLLIGLRQAAMGVDAAIDQRLQSTADEARVRAAEFERDRLNALVHDKVLTTLILAANASAPAQLKAAAASAENALSALSDTETPANPERMSAAVFFDAMVEAAKQIAPEIDCHIDLPAQVLLPGQVATALTQATIQAITNSTQHAGPAAKTELFLSTGANRVKVVVRDDGRGFRESRVPRSRLGIRLSIRQRIEAVGGRAFIQSTPGQGCTVTLTWSVQPHAARGSIAEVHA